MKPLSYYPIFEGENFFFSSKTCSLASSLHYEDILSPARARTNELVQSYFNQWHQVVTSYGKLYNEFSALNGLSTSPIDSSLVSQYDLAVLAKEGFFRDYSYLLIVSMKTCLDLFSVIVQISESDDVLTEFDMTDLAKYAREEYNPNEITRKYFSKLNKRSKYPWIARLKDARNKIIHRGYRVETTFGFEKNEDLVIELVKGIANEPDRVELSIGGLFQSFVEQMPVIDREVSEILRPKLMPDISREIEVSFRFLDLLKEYSYKEVSPSESM